MKAFPHSRATLAAAAAALGAAVAGAVAVAVGARVSLALPGTEVPQTAQTLMVLLAGGVLGPGLGTAALALYLVAGAAGVPVFADGAAGVSVLAGPTGGFLAGFVPAAALAGAAAHGERCGFFRLALWMLAAHALILAIGWGRLSVTVGAERAFATGVAPFIAGAMVKSALAAGALWAWGRWR